jgi:hypothetical protein
LQVSRASLRQARVSAQVAAVLRVWVVARRVLGLVPAWARRGLGLALVVAARQARGSAAVAVAAALTHSSVVAVAIVVATAAVTIMVAAASFPARWPVL